METIQNKLKQIKEGWKNLVFENPEVEKTATIKAEICAGCEKNIMNICTHCGCWISAKVRSKSNCPQKKW